METEPHDRSREAVRRDDDKKVNELQKKKEAHNQKAAPKRRSASRAKSSEPVAPRETEPNAFAEPLQRKTTQAKAESKGKEKTLQQADVETVPVPTEEKKPKKTKRSASVPQFKPPPRSQSTAKTGDDKKAIKLPKTKAKRPQRSQS